GVTGLEIVDELLLEFRAEAEFVPPVDPAEIYDFLVLRVVAVVGKCAGLASSRSEQAEVGDAEPGHSALVSRGSIGSGNAPLLADVLADGIGLNCGVVV